MTALQDPMRSLAGDNAMRRAMAWTFVFAIGWATLEIVLGAELRAPFSLLQIVWCRYAVHLCVVMALWGWRRPAALWSTSRPASHLFRSLLMFIMPGAFTLAVYRGIAPETVWSIFWIAPALIVAFAGWLLKERAPLAVAVTSVAGAVAAAAIFGHVRPLTPTTVILALAVAGSFSLYVVMTRSLREERVETNMFYTALVPFLALTPVMPEVWLWPGPHDAAVLAAIGTLGFGALLALDHACRVAPAWSSSGAFFAQAFCVAAIVAVLSGAAPGLHTALGMTAILLMIAILWIRADRLSPQPGSEPSRA